MDLTRRDTLTAMAGTVLAAAASTAWASTDTHTVVNVEMWDKGPDASGDFDIDNPILLGTAGAALKDRAPMGLALDTYVVPAGEIEFVAKNTSQDFEHEMIVVPWSDLSKPLPYDPDIQRFDEDAAGAIGEIPETEPGATGKLVLHLDPGTYVLACNIPGHYPMGMWTVLTVK